MIEEGKRRITPTIGDISTECSVEKKNNPDGNEYGMLAIRILLLDVKNPRKLQAAIQDIAPELESVHLVVGTGSSCK